MTTNLTRWLMIALLFFTAFAMRIYRLDAVDLRGDEAYSVLLWTATPFTDEWREILAKEPAPVGAFTMYWLWNGMVGTSVFATRMLSVSGNVLSLAVIIALSRRLTNNWRLVAMIALIWALNPFLLWHAQDARTYGVSSALTPLTFYFLLRGLDSQKNQSIQTWFPYILFQTMAIYIYYLEVFWFAAQGVYVLLFRRKSFKSVIRAWIVLIVLIIPVVLQAYTLLIVNRYEGTARRQSGEVFFSRFVPTMFLGENTIPFLLGLALSVVILGSLVLSARKQKQIWLLFVWILVPSILLYIVALFSNYREPRYLMAIQPALLIGIVWALYLLTEQYRPQYRVLTIFTVTLCLVSIIEIYNYFYVDPPKSVNWAGLTEYLTTRNTKNDVIVIASTDPALEYYYHGKADIYYIPWLHEKETSQYQQLIETYQGIYLISGRFTGSAGDFFEANAQHIPGDTFPNLIQFRPWQVSTSEIQHPLNIQFGDFARLKGYTLLDSPDGGAIILLYWEALQQSISEYSILLHLEHDPAVPPIVLDHGLANALISMRSWHIGQTYRDPIAIPLDAPPGDYQMRIGLYETGSPENLLLIQDVVDQYGGRYPVSTISLR